jgi:1-deoxy-D-xylulose-5-phosphate reductoisomerase
MGQADKALPILNALTYPEKSVNSFGRLNFADVGKLTFREYDSIRYPALELCYAAGRKGGNTPALLNAANEEAVYAFLERRIAFTDIVEIVEKAVSLCRFRGAPDLNGIFESDAEARDIAKGLIREIKL